MAEAGVLSAVGTVLVVSPSRAGFVVVRSSPCAGGVLPSLSRSPCEAMTDDSVGRRQVAEWLGGKTWCRYETWPAQVKVLVP